MPDTPRRTVIAVVLAVALVGSAVVVGVGFGQQTTPDDDAVSATQSTSYLRVAHATPGAGMVDVYVDNESVARSVPFGTVSEYVAVDAGNHTVTVTIAAVREAVVLNQTVDLDPRSVTTLTAAVAPNGTGLGSTIGTPYADDAAAPAEDESALRLLHLSPNAPAVDVVATGADGTNETVLAENLSYSNATDYLTLPAGNYTVEVRAADGNETFETVDLSLASGTVHSGLAMGYVPVNGIEQPQDFRVRLVEDASVTARLPSAGTPTANASEVPDENATATEADTETSA